MSTNQPQDPLAPFKYRGITILQWMSVIAVAGISASVVGFLFFT